MKRWHIFIAGILIALIPLLMVSLKNDRDRRAEMRKIANLILAQRNEIAAFSAELKPLAQRIAVYQALALGAKERLSGLEVGRITEIIVNYCFRYRALGLMPSNILALWRQESNFDPDAVSYADAMGMGQLMWLTALPHLYDMGHVRPNKAVLFDPVINAEVSIREIVRLRQFYLGIGIRDWTWPIASYYWGTGNIWRVLWYAHEVMGRVEKYRDGGVL